MKSRTALQVFGWNIAGSLLAASMVLPAWGQTPSAFVSSRVNRQPAVELIGASENPTNSGVRSVRYTFDSSDNESKVPAEVPFSLASPSKAPGGNANSGNRSPRVEPAMRWPELADPEQFKVTNAASNDSWISLQDQDPSKPLPTPQQIQQDSRRASSGMGQGGLLEGSLKPIDLRTGILNNSMQLAVQNRDKDYRDPNQDFIASAVPGQPFADVIEPVTKTWRTPDMLHRPLYFEDENLERYGNGFGAWQPVVSGTRFFSSVVLLPYRIGKSPLRECEYSLGYFRPGDCNPAYKPAREFSGRGAIFQSIVVGGILAGL